MSELKSLVKQLIPFRNYVYAAILCQILFAVFTVVSIPLIIPFFQVLFNDEVKDIEQPENILSGANWLEYQFNELINSYSREDALLYICIIIVCIFFLKNLFRYLALYYMNPARNGIVRNLRQSLYEQFMFMPLHQLKVQKKGDIITRITSDAQEVEWSILQVLEAFIKSPLIIIGSIFFMIYISPSLTLFVFVLLIFTALIIGTISKSLKSESKKLQESLSRITSHVDETLTGMQNIRSYNREDHWKSEFHKENQGFFQRVVAILRRKDLASPLSEFLGISVVSVLLYYGSHKVFQQEFSPETFFAFIFAFYQIIEPAKSFSSAFYSYRKGLAAYERIQEFNYTGDKLLNNQKSSEVIPFDQAIEFKDLSFSYPENENNTLNKLNLSIEKGQTVALVGASGSGKSSIISLLLRFYKNYEGKILVDNKDLNDFSDKSWRDKIALVTQEPFVYHSSLRENVAFGREHVDDNKIRRALQQANLDKFAMNLDLNLGQSGQSISGGERQRVAIARALAGDPEILLLDEPTSSLDPQAEKEVSLAISKAMEGRTSIIVAHRFSTIKHADHIIVLSEGTIVERGTHESLIKLDGFYKKYLSLQTDVA